MASGFLKSGATTFAAAMLLAMVFVRPGIAATPLAYMPPALDYATVCTPRALPPPAIDRDWTQWRGETVDTAADVMFALAGEYLRGSDRLPASPPTAKAMLDYLSAHQSIAQARIDRLLGKTQVSTATSDADLHAGEALLRKAYDAGLIAAASDLAKLYGTTGPATLRDPAKARQFYRVAAASGDVDGQLAYARILANDPTATEATRTLATNTALLGMIQHVATGDCRYMPVIGELFLRGELVPSDINVAIAWLEQYAETGDARTEERLGNLLVSRFVAQADSARAMHYLESAALQGRPAAALTVGIAYASGTTLAQDLAAAEKFLVIAANGAAPEAEQWLARLYAGEFGGAPRPDQARQHFEAALAASPSADLEAAYGQFLAQSSDAADRQKAIGLLRHAADGGMGQAAVLVGRLAAITGGTPAVAETYFRLGADLGKPEGARQMAKIAACRVAGSVDAAGRWTDRALYLGSTTALYDAAATNLASSDAATKAQGLVLMKQAAYKGDPEALAWLIAHLESGRDGVTADAAMANTLLRFIDQQKDADFVLEARLELIKARLALAESDSEKATQIAALDVLVATGAPAAAQLKGDLLHDDPNTDPEQVLSLYATAATSGDKRAMRDYAQALENNPVSAPQAQEWIQKAADAGDLKSKISLIVPSAPEAMAALDAIAQSGAACSADERLTLARAYAALPDPAGAPKAKQWLEASAAVAGTDGSALFKIGDALRDGVGGPDRVATAKTYFERAAAVGRTDAQREIANGYLLGLWPDSSPQQAQSALAALIASGDPGATDMMVKAIAAGQITASLDDIDKMLAGAPRTAKSGDTFMKLVQLDESGGFGAPHADREAEWLQKAADAGNTQAMMRLYRAYAAGIGVAASAETAALWLQKAAEGGDTRAAGELAAAYDVGFGVPIDPIKAAYWRDRAGQQSS